MTKSGEKPAKSAPISKKKNVEAVPEAVGWAVEDFAKDLQYFHNVIGLPNVGKIPKDITAEDVPLSEVEKHFGVKAKNDKNGYKKEGVKGIPAEDIHKLVTALDGIEKFQLYSLEIARGLYYERILKRAVNWAACGVDKHKGQLSWRLRRKAPAQLELPPWKRVEHKYTMPLGLKVNFLAEEEELYCPQKSEKLCEAPGEGTKASDVKVEGRKADVARDESNLKNDQAASFGEGKKASDVGGESNITNEKPEDAQADNRITLEKVKDERVGTLAASTPLLQGQPVEIPLQDHHDNLDSIVQYSNDHSSVGRDFEDIAGDHLSGGKGFDDGAVPEESPMFDNFASPEESPMTEESPMLDQPAPKPESFNKLTSTPIPERKDLLLKSWLEIVDRNLQDLGPQVEKSNLDIAELTTRMEANSKLLKDVEEEIHELTDTMSTCKAEGVRLHRSLEEKRVQKNLIESDMTLLGNDDSVGQSAQGINEGGQAELLLCCSETNALQEAIVSVRQRHAEALSLANSKLPQISKFEDAENSMKDEMKIIKRTAIRLTGSQNALRAEWSRLKQLLGKGLVHVSPFSMVCPLQSEESYFPITECPVCSLGFFCNNWVPTPCGHCYHPNCLFSLLQIDDNRAPKCEACSEVFHPDWLECWGLPQVNHPEVVKLVDEWGLAEQANSFKQSLGDLYSKNASNIEARRKAQAAKHKKVTKLYSRESIKKSTQYHETVGTAELINAGFMRAESKGNWRVGTDGGENSPQETAETRDDLQTVQKLKGIVELSIAKIDKRAPQLGSIVECLSSDSEKAPRETATKGSNKKRKVDLSIVKIEKGAPELGLIVECTSSDSEKAPRETATKGSNKKRKVDLSIVKIEKGAPELGLIVECTSSDSEKAPRETATKGSNKKRKVIGETSKEGKDMGTTAPFPAKLKLRPGTLSQIAIVKSPAKGRGRQRAGVKKLK